MTPRKRPSGAKRTHRKTQPAGKSRTPKKFQSESLFADPSELFDAPPNNRSVEVGDLYSVDGLIRLISIPHIGSISAVKLAKHFHEWVNLAEASQLDLQQVIGRKHLEQIHLSISESADAPKMPEGVTAIGCFDMQWPQWLKTIPHPPAVIFIRGTIPPGDSLGVVGTRNPTRFGVRVVESVVHEAAKHNVGIVSGLALGIDAIAHREALKQGLLTWAILGSGVDIPSPNENLELSEEILKAGGGLLSEQLPGTLSFPGSLVARNRLQSAASFAVVVAQCGIPSGTLHTARFAIEQGRRLVVPRPKPPWDLEPQSLGNMALTDPNGWDTSIFKATENLNNIISQRKPIADVVIRESSDVYMIWD